MKICSRNEKVRLTIINDHPNSEGQPHALLFAGRSAPTIGPKDDQTLSYMLDEWMDGDEKYGGMTLHVMKSHAGLFPQHTPLAVGVATTRFHSKQIIPSDVDKMTCCFGPRGMFPCRKNCN